MDLDINKYLTRINYRDNPTPSLEALKDLQRNHLLNIPFENLDIHLKKKIQLNMPAYGRKL